jgi:hypothetical protein
MMKRQKCLLVSYFLFLLMLLSVEVSSLSSCANFVKATGSPYPFMYFLSSTFVTNYNNSLNSCLVGHPNARPGIIRDQLTYNLSASLLSASTTTGQGWIGMSQVNKPVNETASQKSPDAISGWLWYDGVPMGGNSTYPRYYQWGSGEPNNDRGMEDCAYLFATYGFVDCNCSTPLNPLRVICEVNGKLK